MDDTTKQALAVIDQTLEAFLAGRPRLVEETFDEPAMEALRGKLNRVLSECQDAANHAHDFQMATADALGSWLETLAAVQKGNLSVTIDESFGDEFLDALTEQINETVSRLRELDAERTRQKQQLIEQQAKMIQELSTPIIRVWDQVLALPIIGVVDSMRAKDMMEGLLQSIVANQARCVIIDMTGVTLIDTKTVDYLIKMIQAATLVGSRSVVTGINPHIAQTISRMGLDLGSIETLRDLRAGLARAFELLNLEVIPRAQR